MQVFTGNTPTNTPSAGSSGERIPTVLVKEVLASVNAANAQSLNNALDDALALAFGPKTAWGTLMEVVNQEFPKMDNESAAVKALLRAAIPLLTNPDTPSAELQKIATSLVDQLLSKDNPAFTRIAQKLQATLAQTNPTLQLGSSPAQQSQNLLAAFISNDFAAAAPLMKDLSTKLTLLTPKDLQAFHRVLAPL